MLTKGCELFSRILRSLRRARLKTGCVRSPGPLKSIQRSMLYGESVKSLDFVNSEDSGGVGRARMLKTGCVRSPGPSKHGGSLGFPDLRILDRGWEGQDTENLLCTEP